MNDFLPDGFLEAERRKVFEPNPSFVRRVMARIPIPNPAPAVVWEFVPAFARPTIAITGVILVFILGMQAVYSRPPSGGIVDSYLEADESPVDQWLYHDTELPPDEDLMLEISLVGDFQ